jgi:hypothetical protein
LPVAWDTEQASCLFYEKETARRRRGTVPGRRRFVVERMRPGGASVLAELEFLSVLATERVAQEAFAAVRAEIESAIARGRLDLDGLVVFFHAAEQFADGLHVILIEVGLGQLGGVVCGKDLDLDDMVVLAGTQLLTTAITSHVEHETQPLLKRCLSAGSPWSSAHPAQPRFDAGVASEKHLYYPPIPRFRSQVKLNSGKPAGFGKPFR